MSANPRSNGQTPSAFQDAVSEFLIRHRSVLDVMSKYQEAVARVNRAVAKAVTSCGCIEVTASKQNLPTDISFWDLKEHTQTHLSGTLCDSCRDAIETELGRSLFYTAAMCELLGLDLDRIQDSEHQRVRTLGVFNLT